MQTTAAARTKNKDHDHDETLDNEKSIRTVLLKEAAVVTTDEPTATERIASSQSSSQSSSSSSQSESESLLLWGLWSPKTAIKRKQHLRALFQSIAFCLLIGCALIVNLVFSGTATQTTDTTDSYTSRRLNEETSLAVEEEEECDLDKVDPGWMCAFYALGVLYMFLALAIACDEFFVPALEEMSSKRHLNLSMDVAGATLMAAGGSAPELFSALFGTFTESEIGFGTIIGSAVFNVLFVIAMCSLLSKETLSLTWWPLFRDSTCYAVGLLVLVVFIGVNSKETIELWEACVLFSLYFCYIFVMWKNAAIYTAITGKVLPKNDDDDDDGPQDENPTDEPKFDTEFDANGDQERPTGQVALTVAPTSESSKNNSKNINMATDLSKLTNAVTEKTSPTHLRWQGTFRAGILKLLRDPSSWVTVGGVGIVAKIAGDADYVFRTIDENGDGHIDKQELKKLFYILNDNNNNMSDAELAAVFNQLDTDGDGVIGEQEFNAWYTNSKELIRSQVHAVFHELDADNSGVLDKTEIRTLLVELDPNVTEKNVTDALNAMYQQGSRDEITFEEFEAWYEKSILYERQKQAIEDDMHGVWDSLKPPTGGESTCFGWIQYIIVLPLVLVMAITIPDVRRPGWGKWCYLAFFLSIAWIGAFSFVMVTWTELIGNTLGIPSVIMGLTVLAAGTSIPDLLSSVIVARRGNGDMAVSSSIGSNIFDILVGLPFPWILYTLWPSKPSTVEIGAGNIGISISILLVMLVFVIVTIHFQGWKLTKLLAAFMLWFYFAFLAQAIILEIPFETCG
mmetsp:Transcript_1996/g.2778  ORF Transcript_1996/g.2778 Transcript_1996/m.2778 type:complete len:795 (+) Transcript_1996:328-2712(+)|eukprot:CAMPEP_0198145716 /NCGR_PEP_ID=MMETSP1443-20131203/24856_1 /TAXON_ID=186043 /ORGANISM="Entomoneis sp., Strain CCMP2396" /LENGTH=794 /DNA_ID=CAMNT_0043809419 /DNA_START=203 /DNA_END=2587 /DNA_ORIENTATION=+